MAYTRPAHDSADATWLGQGAYTRPAFDHADASFVTGPLDTTDGYLADQGPLGQPAIYAVLPRAAYLTDGGLPLAPAVFAACDGVAWWVVDTPLGEPQILALANRTAWVSDGGLPLALQATAYTDPTPFIDPAAPITYAMDLLADGIATRVPISSWQATLQNDAQCYVQCVVPAFAAWADAVEAADEFVIWRLGRLVDGMTIEMQMARSPLRSVQTDRGATNYTGTISGYSDAFVADDNPSAIYDRKLSGVRSVSTYSTGGVRVRCAIDWLLRPSQRASADGGLSFVVDYVNYYVLGSDSYMDVGYRAPEL